MALKALVFIAVIAALAFAHGQLWDVKTSPPLASRMHHYASRMHPHESPGDVKQKLKTQPSPMPGFNLLSWLGPWFYQFQKAPCSWAIAEDFTDYTQSAELQGQNVIYRETMRNHDLCNSVTSLFSVTDRPGEFIGKDLIGNNWSGSMIVVATDYKGFAIAWGCIKSSVFDNRCEDPYLYIKTRQPKPRQRVLRRIAMALQSIWGISVDELTRIRHCRPCPFGVKRMRSGPGCGVGR